MYFPPLLFLDSEKEKIPVFIFPWDKYKKARKSVEKTLEELFPEEARCLGGVWSFVGTELDIVYPEVALYDPDKRKTVHTGLIIHSARPGKQKEAAYLVKTALGCGLPLLLLAPGQCPPAAEMRRRIELIFKGRLTLKPGQ